MAGPIRAAQILGRMDSGGIEAVVMNYYRHIDRSRIQFDFYLAADSSFPQREEVEGLGGGICLLPTYSRPLAYHRALYRAFRGKRYQIVHAHLSTMSVFPLFAAWRAGVPVRICHNHTTAHWGEGIKTLLKYILRPFAPVFATDLFACGETAGRWMYGRRRFELGKVTVMPNAIDTARFARDPQARAARRGELGIAEDAFVVGHVGRFMYQKNHDFLLEIFAALRKERPNAVLLLVGEGERMEQIREKAEALGMGKHAVFAGARRDVHKLYSAMDVFCLPSFYEGMPVVAWEAQANGLPCVFSDTVSREAQVSPDVRFMSLRETAEAWGNALLHAEGRGETHVPDIRDEAARLAAFYEEKSFGA